MVASALLLLLCLGATAALIYSAVQLSQELSVSPSGLLTSTASGAGVRVGGSRFELATVPFPAGEDVGAYLKRRYPAPEFAVAPLPGGPENSKFWSVTASGAAPALVGVLAAPFAAPPATLADLCRHMVAEGASTMTFDFSMTPGAYAPFTGPRAPAPGPPPSYTLVYRPVFSLGCEPVLAAAGAGGAAGAGLAERVTMNFQAGVGRQAVFSCFDGVCDTFAAYTPDALDEYFAANAAAGAARAARPPAPAAGRRLHAEL